MTRCRSATPDPEHGEHRGENRSVTGVVITQRLVAPEPGRASGTFSAVGAIEGQGTVVTDAFVPARLEPGAPPTLVEGAVRLIGASGEIFLTIRTVLRPVPDTGVLTGGGTWNVTHGSGNYDGLRAAGTLTLVVVYDAAGAATLDVVLTGRAPAAPGLSPAA